VTCGECPPDSSCSEVGFTLKNLPVDRGAYRFSAHSDDIYRCPAFDLCSNGKTCACAGSSVAAGNSTAVTAGDALCAEHTMGPFCMLCEAGAHTRSHFSST